MFPQTRHSSPFYKKNINVFMFSENRNSKRLHKKKTKIFFVITKTEISKVFLHLP